MSYMPKVSFLIPTLNAEKYLEKCLESIKDLKYPTDLIEVFIADGGSIDSTLAIAKKYRTTILKNDRKIAEYGKKIAFDRSEGEIIAFLDSDNVIASSDWLNRMLEPFQDPNVIGVESNYLINSDFTPINTYVALLVIADPVARMIASRPEHQHKVGSYRIKEFAQGGNPVAGANGFLWRRSIIRKFSGNRPDLNEVLLLDTCRLHQ